MDLKSCLSGNLKKQRTASKISQTTLAENARVSMKLVSEIERGIVWPRPDTIKALAQALKVPETALFADPSIIDDEMVLERVRQALKRR